MQKFNTNDMAHQIPRCIEWASSIHTLEPGDILATGTNHRGLNSFMDGDKIELTVEKVGTLKFNVKDEHKRTWARTTRLQHKERAGGPPHAPDSPASTRRSSLVTFLPPRSIGAGETGRRSSQASALTAATMRSICGW